MLDIGWQELLVIAVVALVVIGPKDLPKAIKAVTAMMRKARGLAREFQNGIDDMMREAELDEMKRQVDSIRKLDLKDTLRDSVDPTGTLTEDFNPADFARELKDRREGGPEAKPPAAEAAPGAGGKAGAHEPSAKSGA
jgi:sec-independent protein translocase protein TatB